MKLFYFDESEVNLIIYALEIHLRSLKEIQNNTSYKTLHEESKQYYETKRLQFDKLITYIKNEMEIPENE